MAVQMLCIGDASIMGSSAGSAQVMHAQCTGRLSNGYQPYQHVPQYTHMQCVARAVHR